MAITNTHEVAPNPLPNVDESLNTSNVVEVILDEVAQKEQPPIAAGTGLTSRVHVSRNGGREEENDEHHLNKVRETSLLTREDEVDLSQRIQAGLNAQKRLQQSGRDISPSDWKKWKEEIAEGKKAAADFVTANLRLVIPIAKKLAFAGEYPLPWFDLAQEGITGLIRAVQKFDWRKDFSFSTYATAPIRKAIKESPTFRSRNTAGLVIPEDVDSRLPGYYKDLKKLRDKLGVEPSDRELAEFRFERVQDIERYRAAAVLKGKSLNLLLSSDTDKEDELSDLIPDLASNEDELKSDDYLNTRHVLNVLRNVLTRPEYLFLVASYGFVTGLPMDNTQTAEFITKDPSATASRVTPKAVVQLRKDAITKLQHPATYPIVRQLLSEQEDDQEWRQDASCQPDDLPEIVDTILRPHATDKEKAELRARVEKFKDICRGCVVRQECLTYAESLKPRKGVWGSEEFHRGSVVASEDPPMST